MTTRLSQSRSGKRGFTLVEILVVITVIGILVGMLSVAVIPALRNARQTTVIMEMKQIDQAIVQFETDYGFYPPSFEGITSHVQLQRYVNRMAPNNRESEISPTHPSETRLQHWYEQIGQYLDQESSLVFWLSGTFKNQQYPITNAWDGTTPTYIAAHAYNDDGLGERNVYYEFRTSQLFGDDADEIVEYIDATDALMDIPTDRQGFICEYKQGHGPGMKDRASEGSDLLFKYRDVASYGMVTDMFPAYHDGTAFINPTSFQLVTLGMDGKPGDAGNAFDAVESVGGDDNLCNFADGTLLLWVTNNEQ